MSVQNEKKNDCDRFVIYTLISPREKVFMILWETDNQSIISTNGQTEVKNNEAVEKKYFQMKDYC